ncbi:hypothetical protein FNF27_06825 [Cafeteria roenbergensis]|uniref:Uncharacterized protein n=1 Tax=Cafeteria roenbergensis TaxID=33653 RepID=A0A5A8C9F7_CAFRO|nr:hypothetical protein FNF29_05776 [Cafeteria roenbergensis]KAA0169800.1 hypothetical protein FNF27_06825 [Cafeteria roenbergensis]|eukprot:KAA0149766.1 hypothetical protein FNF29_05776 [Cafeteria roenbergensis]
MAGMGAGNMLANMMSARGGGGRGADAARALMERLKQVSATAASSGNLVHVTARGDMRISEVRMEDAFLKQPKALQEVMLRDTVNEALNKVQPEVERMSKEAMTEMAKQAMASMGGGMFGGGGAGAAPGGAGAPAQSGGMGGALKGLFPGLGNSSSDRR